MHGFFLILFLLSIKIIEILLLKDRFFLGVIRKKEFKKIISRIKSGDFTPLKTPRTLLHHFWQFLFVKFNKCSKYYRLPNIPTCEIFQMLKITNRRMHCVSVKFSEKKQYFFPLILRNEPQLFTCCDSFRTKVSFWRNRLNSEAAAKDHLAQLATPSFTSSKGS